MADLYPGWKSSSWWQPKRSPKEVKSLLLKVKKEGYFVIRESSTERLYVLSLYHKEKNDGSVVHYRIKQNTRLQFYLGGEYQYFNSIPDLVNYYQYVSSRLVSKLKMGPEGDRPVSPTAGRNDGKKPPNSLKTCEELGVGYFGTVSKGTWHGSINVAVKRINDGAMSNAELIKEAEVMATLKHRNVVQLYTTASGKLIRIVMEYMEHGSLLTYLSSNKTFLRANVGRLLNMCIQVCKAMYYLESKSYIHRDLAARNCLVGSDYVVKVSDFGLTRCAIRSSGLYIGNNGSIFAPRWAAPEIFGSQQFSSKSDVWAYGVLMWEIFTCGEEPYSTLNMEDLDKYVQQGRILKIPTNCRYDVYDVMKDCWSHSPEERPNFRELREDLSNVYQLVLFSN